MEIVFSDLTELALKIRGGGGGGGVVGTVHVRSYEMKICVCGGTQGVRSECEN